MAHYEQKQIGNLNLHAQHVSSFPTAIRIGVQTNQHMPLSTSFSLYKNTVY